jgi:serine/threonine protein kinase
MGKPSILHTGSTKPGRSGKGLVTTGPVPLS